MILIGGKNARKNYYGPDIIQMPVPMSHKRMYNDVPNSPDITYEIETYRAEEMRFGDGDTPIFFYVIDGMTVREALLILLSDYDNTEREHIKRLRKCIEEQSTKLMQATDRIIELESYIKKEFNDE